MRRWLLRVLVVLLLLPAAALPFALRVRAVEDLVRAQIVDFLSARLTGTITVGRVHGVLPRSLVVEDLRLMVDDRPVVELPELRLVVSPWTLLMGRLRLARVELQGLRVRAVEDARGWHVPGPRPRPPLTIVVELGRVVVEDARIEFAVPSGAGVRHVALDDVSLAARARLSPWGHLLTVDELRVRPRGLPLGAVRLAAQVHVASDGAVDVTQAKLATAASRVMLAGRYAPGRDADARLDLAPLARRDVRALVPDLGLRADVAGTATVRGPWHALALVATADLGAAGRGAATGTLDLGRTVPRWVGRATFADADPSALLGGLPRAHASGRARVHGRGRALSYGIAVADASVEDVAVTRGLLTARSVRGVHRGHVDVEAAGIQVAGRGRLVVHGEPAYRAAGRIAAPDLAALRPALTGHARVAVALRGRGLDAETRRADVRATLAGADVAGIVLDSGTLAAVVDRERLTVERLALGGPGLRAEGHGTADGARRTIDAVLDATADLSHLAAPPPVTGALTLHATAGGRVDAPAIAVQLTGVDLTTARGALRDLHVDAGGTVHGPAAGGTLAAVARGITGPGGTIREAATTLAWKPAPDGVAATVSALSLTPEAAPGWQLARPATLALGPDVRVAGLVLQSDAQRMTLDGHAGAHGPADATLALADVDAGPLCALVAASCEGTLSGRARLEGTADAPRWTLDARADRLAGAGIAIGSLEAHATYATRSAALRALLRTAGGGELQADASLPIDLAWDGAHPDLSRAPLAGALHAHGLSLAFLGALAPGELRDPRGVVTADLRVGGSRATPQLDGAAVLSGGHVLISATGVTYDDVAATLRFGGAGVELTEVRARTGEGTLSADGRVGLDGLRLGALAVTIRLHEFAAVRLPVVDATVAGPLTLEGTATAPMLRGSVLVTHAVVRPAMLPSTAVREVRDPTIEVVGMREQPGPPSRPFPLADALGLELRIKVGQDAWIRRVDTEIALGGEVRVTRHPPEPMRLDGRIRLQKGWYNFQGRRFAIDGGGATFTPEHATDPELDVRASYRSPEYVVTVQVGGTLRTPALTLSSDPPLDQADVLAVILFGKPVNALARGEVATLQHQTSSLGAGFIMPELRDSVISSLGISTLDVEMPAQNTGAAADPGLVRVGRYVSSDLFVSLAQEFGTRAGQVFGLEYALTQKLSLKLSTSTRGSSAIDAFWHRRY